MSEPNSPVFMASSEDPAMQQAIKRARQTFRFFWRELSWEYRRIVPGLDIAAVKIAFEDPPGTPKQDPDQPAVEEMWVSDIQFDGQQVSGTLINNPNWLTSVSEGDDVIANPMQVNDWMYAINQKVCGAFTVNVIRAAMSKSERRAHDDAWGLDFGHPESIVVVPPDYIGQPAPKKSFLGGSKPVVQDLAEVAKREHPMAINMLPSLEEQLTEDPSIVHQTDERGFTFLHQLTLAGSAASVAALLTHDADPNAVASNGMTPLRLAKSLGWKDVAEVLVHAGAQ
ncbi:DUF2314 domain-containing protein [Rubripirellula amarantea]|nr:DUF2314 domain-containing protein [Rubripirellula amarantea]